MRRSLVHTHLFTLASSLFLLATPPAYAQDLLETLEHPFPFDDAPRYGEAIAGVPDTDGDGRGDVLVGAAREYALGSPWDAGRTYLFSGASGDLLFEFRSPNEEGFGLFGSEVAGVPDADGDGRGDLLIGAEGEERTYLFSGATGELLYEIAIHTGSIAGVPDTNGDGLGDLLLGGPRDLFNPDRRADLVSGATGELLFSLALPPGEGYVDEVAGVPDIDGDGTGDLVVSSSGRVLVFSGATGELRLSLTSPSSTDDFFGDAVAGLSDLNGDGRGDLLIGAPYELSPGVGNSGRAYVFGGASGTLLATLESDVPMSDRFGRSVAAIPNGDGSKSVAVAHNYGVELFVLTDGGTITAQVPVPPEPNYRFAIVAGVPDTNGDGRGELVTGSGFTTSPSTALNEVYLFSSVVPGALTPPVTDFGEAAVGTTSAPQAVLVRNPGLEPLTVSSVSVGGETADQFEVASAPEVPFTVEPGESVTVEVVFVPTVDQAAEATLTAVTSAGDLEAGLVGIGELVLMPTPASVDFGIVEVGTTSAAQVVEFESNLSEALRVEAIVIGGTDPDRFDLASAPTTPFDLAPGGLFGVEVRFSPTQVGEFEAVLFVETADGDQPVPLRGLSLEADTTAFFVVTKVENTADGVCDVDCSLREAVQAANSTAGADTVAFAPRLNGQTIDPVSSLTISDDLYLSARGQNITVDGTDVQIEVGTLATLVGLSFTGSNFENEGTLLIEESTLRGGVDQSDPALINTGVATLRRSTITEYFTFAERAVDNRSGATLNVEYSTITNTGNAFGGINFGISSYGTLTISNSTIAYNNDLDFGGADVVGAGFIRSSIVGVSGGLTSGGHNVFGTATSGATDTDVVVGRPLRDEVLASTLADNGGPTPTLALRSPSAGNPAVDIGGTCGPVDQRGFPAPVDGTLDGPDLCDAGAIEYVGGPPPPVILRLAKSPSAPSFIPPSGGPYPFLATLVNLTDEAQTTQAWSNASRFGEVFGPLLGPLTVTLAPRDTLVREVVQNVPAGALNGPYFYTGFVGTFPDSPVDSSSFGVSKRAGLAGGTNVWSVLDAQTGDVITPETRWVSERMAGDGTEAASSANVPTAFALGAAYPNPFQQTASLALDVPHTAEVTLTVYDVLGRAVATLLDGEAEAGRHEVLLDGAGLPSGVYLVRMASGSFAATQRVTLVR